MKFQIIQASGWATILTFLTGIVIFTLERFGFFMLYVPAIPFLYLGEVILLIFFGVWFVWFLIFLALALARRPRTQ